MNTKRHPTRSTHIVMSMILFVVLPSPFHGDARAEERLWRTELRAGTSINSLDVTFYQFDVGLIRRLPWNWLLWETLEVSTGFTATAGVLAGGGDAGVLGTSGIEFTFGSLKRRFPITIRAGSAVTLIGEERYGDENLGGSVHSTSHISLHYRLIEHLNTVARYQHMSNAGIDDDNPGIDMVMLDIVFWF